MSNPILIIDDDLDFISLLKKSFRARGIDLLCATTGTEGLALLKKMNPIAVLLDQMLPDVKGENLLGFIRSYKQDLPVILLTGVSDIPLVVRTIQGGEPSTISQNRWIPRNS